VLQNFRGGSPGDLAAPAGRGLRVFDGGAGGLFGVLRAPGARPGAAGKTGSGHAGLAG
jgi:hypothetical protein